MACITQQRALLPLSLWLALAASPAFAATYNWSVATGSWTNAANWSPNGVPGSTDTVYITNSGTAQISGSTAAFQGGFVGSNSTLAVSGSGTLLSIGSGFQLGTGSSGQGSFNLTQGAVANLTNLQIGQNAGTTGAVTVDGPGSKLSLSIGSFLVGNYGQGSMTVSGGATVTTNTQISIAYNAGSAGSSINVTGTGSTLNTGSLVVGGNDAGVLNIANGGVVNSTGATLTQNPGATARVTITGSNSAWNVAYPSSPYPAYLLLGNGGSTSVVVADQGTLNLFSASGATRNIVIGGRGAGILQIGNGGAAGTVSADVITSYSSGAPGQLIFDHTDPAYVFAPQITSNVALSQNDTGTTILTANNNYRGGTSINAGTLQLGNGGATGSIIGNVTGNAGGRLAFARSDVYVFNGVVSGAGDVIQFGPGTTVFDLSQPYTGQTTVQAGTLVVGSGAGSAGSLAGGGAVTVNTGATLGGYGSVAGSINNAGTLAVANALPLAAGGSIGAFTVQGGLSNSGAVHLSSGSPSSIGNVLKVGGNYVGNGGTLTLQTLLNEGGALSNQTTDRLLVEGGASGQTIVNVVGSGSGASTSLLSLSKPRAGEGISIIQVAGDPLTQPFHLGGAGYVAAGPWRYDLYVYAPGNSDPAQRVVGGTTAGFWDYRLQNAVACESGNCNEEDDHNANGPNGEDTEDNKPGGQPSETDDNGNEAPRPALVPQMAAYLVAPTALYSYGAAVLDNLHDRLGEVRHDLLAHDLESHNGEVFARVIVQNQNYRSDVDFTNFGYGFHERMSMLQVGGNWLGLDMDRGTMRAGLAFSSGTDRIEPRAPDGYSLLNYSINNLAATFTYVGVNGFYADGVVSHDNYLGRAYTRAYSDAVSRPSTHGWSASLEGGYSYLGSHEILWEPQAQVMWQSLSGMNFTDLDGVVIQIRNTDQWTGRLGMRVSRTWLGDEPNEATTPYLRFNYYLHSNGRSTVAAGSEFSAGPAVFRSGAAGQAWELQLGATRTVTDGISVYLDARYLDHTQGYGFRGWVGDLGFRWRF
jgi:outer membrane autotransporter protein